MRAVTRIVLTTAGVGTATIGSAIAVNAQYYYPPPGYDYPPPPRRVMAVMAGEPGTAVPLQGGACQPYRGPTGGGWRTWNGCPRGYTIQGGECRPYRGY